jgi:hypothetical protein
MKELLDGKFAPITHSWGFLEAPLEKTVKAYLDWKRKIYPPSGPAKESLKGDLPRLLSRLHPLTAPPTMILWVATRSNWTAYFDNSLNGSDAFPPVNYLANALACHGVRVACCPNTLTGAHDRRKGRYGAVIFEVYGPEGSGPLKFERTISAANDGGRWTFNTSGNPLPVEMTDAYSNRRIRDRFTAEMLETYCQAFSIRLFDVGFYGPEAVLCREGQPNRSVSLHQRQVEIGLLKSANE